MPLFDIQASSDETGEKFKTRINLLQKLVGTDRGANGNTLKTAVLSLVYSVAEYCVRYRSSHVDKVDTQHNNAVRTSTRPIDSTPLLWLHVLSNIAPSKAIGALIHHEIIDFRRVSLEETSM